MTPFKNYKLIMVLLVVVACSPSDKKGMGLGNVQRIDLIQKVSLTGTLRGKRSSYIYPAYSGYVADLKAVLGNEVKEGTPLVKITQTSDQPLSQVFPIRAPFSGKITQVLKSEGEFVHSSSNVSMEQAILRLDDLSEYWVDVSVPEIDIAKVKLNQNVQIRPNAISNLVYQGLVKEIALSSKSSDDRWDRGKVEFAVLIQLTNPDSQVLPGMTAVVDIIAAKADKALVLPHEYIHRDEDRYFVVTPQDQEKDVKVGLSNEAFVQILSGVDEGEQVKMIDFVQASKNSQGGTRGRRSAR